jgi:hypothetical protein
MTDHVDTINKWVVRFGEEQIEFANFSAAVSYADSLALRRALIKQIDPIHQLIELGENKHKRISEYQADDHGCSFDA